MEQPKMSGTLSQEKTENKNGIEEFSPWLSDKLNGLKSTEEQALQEFRAVYATSKPKLAADTNTLIKFLVARSFSVKDAKKQLDAHLEWRKEFYPVKLSSCANDPMILGGASYALGVDKEGYPVYVVRSCKFRPKERNIDANLRYAVFIVTYLIEKHKDRGRFTVVYDREGFSLRKHLDLDLVKTMAKILSNNFPESLHRALVVPTGPVFRSIWSMAQYFFDPNTRTKFLFLAKNTDLQKYIEPDQLEKRLGGNINYEFKFSELTLPEQVGIPDPWA